MKQMAKSGQKLDPALRKQIVRMLSLGCSRRQIVAACFVCKRTVDKIAREESVSIRPAHTDMKHTDGEAGSRSTIAAENYPCVQNPCA